MILSFGDDQYGCLDTHNLKICPLFQMKYTVEEDTKFMALCKIFERGYTHTHAQMEQCQYHIGLEIQGATHPSI